METTGPVARGAGYELIDTGVFDDDRYFDVFVEYAKAAGGYPDPDHGPQPRTGSRRLHVLPTLWFRNTWSWTPGRRSHLRDG